LGGGICAYDPFLIPPKSDFTTRIFFPEFFHPERTFAFVLKVPHCFVLKPLSQLGQDFAFHLLIFFPVDCGGILLNLTTLFATEVTGFLLVVLPLRVTSPPPWLSPFSNAPFDIFSHLSRSSTPEPGSPFSLFADQSVDVFFFFLSSGPPIPPPFPSELFRVFYGIFFFFFFYSADACFSYF